VNWGVRPRTGFEIVREISWVAIIAACVWFLVAAGWGTWAFLRLRRERSHTRFGRFLANWVGITGYLVGLAGFWVLVPATDDRLSRGGAFREPYLPTWGEALGIAIGAGLVIGALITLLSIGTSLDTPDPVDEAFPADFVEDVLADEREASQDQRRRTAAMLLDEAERSGERLPNALDRYVRRNAPELLGRRQARRV
jgi:hypothetical protein